MGKSIKYAFLGWILTCIVVNVHAQTLPVDTINGWQLSWNDEFNYPDSELENNWISDNQSYEGFVLCSRWRENAEVHDGILELKARKEKRGDNNWTCGNVWTKKTFGYGYFECRYKYAGATGTNSSFWLWPKVGVPEGEKAFEIDINEGHFPNIVNTNIHNWTDKLEDGSHAQDFKDFAFGRHELKPSYIHVFGMPVKAQKIRLSSTHHTNVHIRELRVYAPGKGSYPEDAEEETQGLINLARAKGTTITASGQYHDNRRSSDIANIADGSPKAWISQVEGDKWLELDLGGEKEIGCIQFTNGWEDHGGFRNLLSNYKLEYYNGERWIIIADFDGSCEIDFSEEYHTYGLLWNDKEFKFYFDGQLIRTVPHSLCHAKTNILLSLAILTWDIAGPVTDAIDGTSMKIDYVRYYKKNQ